MKAVLVVVAVSGAGILLFARPWAGGVELSYALRFPPAFEGDRAAAARETALVLERRVGALGGEARAGVSGERTVILRLGKPGRFEQAALLARLSKPLDLRLLVAAERAGQERFNRTREVPPGFRAWPVDLTIPRVGPDLDPWRGPEVLLSEEVVRGGGEVESATLRQVRSPARTVHSIDLRLAPMATMRRMGHPSSVLAVVWDGRVAALLPPAPGVDLEVLGPRCAAEAENWRMGLLGGALPVAIGKPEIGRYRGRLRF